MLCIGVPTLFKSLLLDALSHFDISETPGEPYTLHIPVIEAIVSMQDLSLWSMRDIVRGIEIVSSSPGYRDGQSRRQERAH